MGEPGLPATLSGLRLLAQELLDRITVLEKACTCGKRDHSPPRVEKTPSGWATAVKKKPKKSATKPPSPQSQPDDRKRSQSPITTTPSSDIPPVILLDTALWSRLYKQLSSEKIVYTEARNVRDGIRIQMPDTKSLQKTINLLEKSEFPYRSPASDSGAVRAVMRGVPVAIPAESIKDDLASQGFKVLKIARMCDRSTKKPFPLLHVTLASGDEEIFKITRSMGLDVSVEKPRSTNPPPSSPVAAASTLPQVSSEPAAPTLPQVPLELAAPTLPQVPLEPAALPLPQVPLEPAALPLPQVPTTPEMEMDDPEKHPIAAKYLAAFNFCEANGVPFDATDFLWKAFLRAYEEPKPSTKKGRNKSKK